MVIVVFTVSTLVTGLIRRYAIERNVMDLPKDRSSHVKPTPTGGGLSISFSVLFFLMYAWWLDTHIRSFVVGLGIGGSIVAITGWLDDHKEISPVIRIIL